MYVGIYYNNKLFLTKNKRKAALCINNKIYISPLRKAFNNVIAKAPFPGAQNMNSPKIYTIILSAGTSSRFKKKINIDKQLYILNSKPIINHSIDLFSKYSTVIVITNSKCKIESDKNPIILINDINDRLESINTGLKYINAQNAQNAQNARVIIHDAARPFITDSYVKKLLKINRPFVQYFTKINNGLYKLYNKDSIIDREDFIELCSPLCINIDFFNYIWYNFIYIGAPPIAYEFLQIFDLFYGHPDFKYKMIEGNSNILRKITTYGDIPKIVWGPQNSLGPTK